MKKGLLLIFALIVCLSFSACGVNMNTCAHEYKIVECVSATCTQTGNVVYQCCQCDHQFQMEQPKVPHYFAGGNCTTVNVCTNCGETASEPKGHTYDENSICIRCGHQDFSQGLDFTANSAGTGYIVTGIGTCLDKEIVIPKMHQGMPVTGIGYDAFYGCLSVTSVTVPDSVTNIGGLAFCSCWSLISLNIPDSVTIFGHLAFSGCTSLTSITFNGTKAQWEAIEKGDGWNNNTGNYTIYCIDGEITK